MNNIEGLCGRCSVKSRCPDGLQPEVNILVPVHSSSDQPSQVVFSYLPESPDRCSHYLGSDGVKQEIFLQKGGYRTRHPLQLYTDTELPQRFAQTEKGDLVAVRKDGNKYKPVLNHVAVLYPPKIVCGLQTSIPGKNFVVTPIGDLFTLSAKQQMWVALHQTYNPRRKVIVR